VSLLLTILFLSCTTIEERKEFQDQATGQLSFYLNGPEKASLDIRFNLLGVKIISDTGITREITNAPQNIHSFSVKGRQAILAERRVPEGYYNKLQLLLSEVTIRKEGRIANLALPPEGIEIPVSISITKNKNASLFLLWNVDASVSDNYMFNPAFSVKKITPNISSLLVYVTNELSDNVSVINRDSGEVVSNIMVGKNPRGIATSLIQERTKIYVANAGSNSISVIDPNTQKVENEIPIRYGREPEGIAVGRVASDNELIFVTNFSSDSVSVFDSTSFQEIEKINVGRSPIAVAADPPVEELSGSRFLSFEEIMTLKSYRERFCNVYVANYNSNTVSVVSMDLSTKRSSEIVTLNVDWNPIAISIDFPRGRVYIANYGSDKISVINILDLIKGNDQGSVSDINHVAHSITGIISDPVLDRLYLLKQNPDQIIVLRPFDKSLSSLQTVMPPIIGVIPVGNAPRAFILDPEIRKFYVTNQGSSNISVVDKTSRKQESTIPVGSKPYGMALLSE
jgi:YVTN family beta-propeller protein